MEDGYHQGIQVAPHTGLHPVNPDNSQKEVYVTTDLSHVSTVVFAQQSLKTPRICGLQRGTFWLAAILGAIIFVLLVAGGTMGGLLAKDRSAMSSKNATSTANSNQHEPTTIVVVSSVATAVTTTIFVQPSATSSSISATTTSFTDCPSSNGTIFTAQTNLTGSPPIPGTSFRKYCNTHLVSNNNMNFITLNDFNNCITACAQANLYTLSSNTNCTGVSFASRTSGCWLHAGPEPIGVGGAQGEDSAIVVALR